MLSLDLNLQNLSHNHVRQCQILDVRNIELPGKIYIKLQYKEYIKSMNPKHIQIQLYLRIAL